MLFYPPSLPADILARSFVASNGELGLYLSDVEAFLKSCQTDHIAVLGWEAWIISHAGQGKPAPGSWTGLIPMQNGTTAIVGGDGDVDDTRKQYAAFRPDAEVAAAWRPFLRVNITIDC